MVTPGDFTVKMQNVEGKSKNILSRNEMWYADAVDNHSCMCPVMCKRVI